MTPIFKASCQSGKLIFENRGAFERYLWDLKAGPLEVIVRRPKVQRSLDQNAYYHGVVVKLIADFCGYDPEECHSALKARFLTEHHEDGLDHIRSTASLTTIEFTEYVEKCRKLGAELGIVIPDPGEVAA